MPATASTLLNRLLARARFRHVQVLVRLAELGSLRRAADAIGISQPGVSQLLADLEQMMDAPLFQRHARGVRPTPACVDLLPAARQLLFGMAVAAETMAARGALGQGVVRIGGTTSAINGLLTGAVPRFNQRHPHVQLQVAEAGIEALLLAARNGELDLICCREIAVLPEGWRFEPLASDEMVAVADARHPLARRRRVTPAQLAKEVWLPPPAGSLARESFDALCAGFPEPARICDVVTRVPALTWAMLRAQRLLTLVPAGVMRQLTELGELAVLALDAPMTIAPLGIMLPAQQVPVATALLAQFLRVGAASAPRTKKAG